MRLYTVWSSPYKGVSHVTQRVDRLSKELCLEDGKMRSLLRQERDLDSSGSATTRSRGGIILPIPQKKYRQTQFSHSVYYLP
jgi:hypothetical protein